MNAGNENIFASCAFGFSDPPDQSKAANNDDSTSVVKAPMDLSPPLTKENGSMLPSASVIAALFEPVGPSTSSSSAFTREAKEPGRDSYFSKTLNSNGHRNKTPEFDNDDDLGDHLSAMPGFDSRRKVRFSDKSMKVLEDSNRLLESIQKSRSFSTNKLSLYEKEKMRRRSESPEDGEPLPASTSRFLLHTPRFPRIDFDDMLGEELEDRKPAWKQLQDNIKTSYHKPKRTVERHREINEVSDLHLSRRPRTRRSESPFAHLDSESFLPRAPSWMASGAMNPRGLNTAGSGPYAAPFVSSSQGVESTRYDRKVNEIEARLLKTSILPENMKTITKKEFRQAPFPSAGSASEQYADEDDMLHVLPRPFYSRPNRRDPDYFDFDLQHSVDMYRRPEGRYVPRGPQPWETKLLNEYKGKGEAPLSAYMFNQKGPQDYRSTGTSYLSAALRTPSFWEHRFTSIGNQVRDSNPISLASIERNKPVPNKFTEYRDPDFEDYDDPKAPD